MTNRDDWQPPTAGATPPPPPSGAGPEAPLTANEPSGSRGGRGKLITLVVGVAVLVAAGVFALTRLVGDDSDGGADTAEDAGLSLLSALENEDILGMVDVLLPGERETLRDPVTDLVAELSRLEVLTSDASLSDVGGVDVVIESEAAAATPTNVEDITNVELSGTISVSVDGEALPIGDLIYDNVPEADPAEADVEATDPEPFQLPLTAVREDGRWYVSLFHTVAELARAETDLEIPAEAIEPTGGDSPEDAFDAFLDGVEMLNLEAIIAALNPQEFQALQRYAPAFIGEGQAELDAAGIDVTLDEADYAVEGDGDQRSITVTYLSGAITAEGETVTFEYEDGCFRAQGGDPGETIDSCELEGATAEEIFGTDAEVVDDLLTTLEQALGDYENPGLIVKRVDGTWYLSPFATGSEQLLAFLRALDRGEIDSIIDEVTQLASDFSTEVMDLGEAVPSSDEGSAVPDTIVPDTIPDESVVDSGGLDTDTVPGSIEEGTDAGSECYLAENGTDAADCFEALIATGELSPSSVPVYLRAAECGLAELYWSGDYFSLPDAEFSAAVEAAAPCFEALLADGTLDEIDLPLELSNPECLEGRNWYAGTVDDDYYDRVIACAYG